MIRMSLTKLLDCFFNSEKYVSLIKTDICVHNPEFMFKFNIMLSTVVMSVTVPPPKRTAIVCPCVLRTAILWFRVLRTVKVTRARFGH